MNWERLFFYLKRFNAVAIFLALCTLAFALISEYLQHREWGGDDSHIIYASPGLDNELQYEGGEIKTPGGAAVSYMIERDEEYGELSSGKNLSLTEMKGGNSRLVLPENSDQTILRWEPIGYDGEGSDLALAYMVFAGSEQDKPDGYLDLIVGRLSDLEQRTIKRRLRFVDAARMVDESTLSMIVWPENEKAEFWLIDLTTLQVTLRRPVQLPKPESEAK